MSPRQNTEGLRHPEDLQAWRRWQRRRRALPEAKARIMSRLRPQAAEGPGRTVLHVRGERPLLLAALEGTTPTKVAAVLTPLKRLDGEDLAVLAPEDVTGMLPGEGWRSVELPAEPQALERPELAEVRDVLGVGHYLRQGEIAQEWIAARNGRFWVVQHGLLVPMAPPLPPNARLLAFTEQDGAFWRSGRRDVEVHAVGSQLLWEAARLAEEDRAQARQDPAAQSDAAQENDDAPVYLGQLHGAELNRLMLAWSSFRFCRRHGAEYRPHPGERDLLSRVIHRIWKACGIRFASTEIPLAQLERPVVSAFSTGLLEAAARGQRAWAYHTAPPQWLREFWGRYNLREWGMQPSAAPEIPDTEPAQQIARILRASMHPQEA